MSLEPINSVMTSQAQQVSKPAPKTAAEYTDVTLTADTAKIDDTTRVVEKAENKSESYDREPSQDQLRKAVEDLNKKMSNSEVAFGFHEGTNRVMIRIVDKETKEIIKELPPEKTLDLIAKAWELAGIMVDERR
ncbi:MAG: flagellar protein FlaG [Lachnospiraceae bacterium]|nr:flagellar protein FlaG [Lachnospiraceae bacterium]MCR4933456.1 flagellar protein FlaG [Lachnospiraceae bacterium]